MKKKEKIKLFCKYRGNARVFHQLFLKLQKKPYTLEELCFFHFFIFRNYGERYTRR